MTKRVKELGETNVYPFKFKTEDNTKIFNYGMNLREYYAGLAMQSLISSYKPNVALNKVIIANEAVIYADELLKELCREE